MPADALACLLFKALIKVNGLLDQPAELVGKRVDGDQSGGMPGGAGGEFGSLDKANVSPPPMDETVKNVGADTAASNDNDPSM